MRGEGVYHNHLAYHGYHTTIVSRVSAPVLHAYQGVNVAASIQMHAIYVPDIKAPMRAKL